MMMAQLEYYAEYRDYCRQWFKEHPEGTPPCYDEWLVDNNLHIREEEDDL
jgi:hypothetical protein